MAHLAPSTAAAIGDRLSKDVSLKLPASMQEGTSGGAVPDQQKVKQYLSNLLERDAGVFLERYGDKLSLEERGLFQALRVNDYEVNFHLSALEAAERRHTPAGRSTAVTNRRWAALQRLEQGGEYFAEEAMRRRAPLLFQLYFGERGPGAAPAAGSAGGGKLSDLLLRQHDEALTRQRLAREQAREAEVEQETDSEEEEEEARQAKEEQEAESEEEEEEEAEGKKRRDSSFMGSGEACGGASRAEAVSRPAGAAPMAPSAARSLHAEGADTQGDLPPSSSDAPTVRRHGSSGGGGHAGSGRPDVGGAEGGDAGNGRTGMGAAEGGYRVEEGDAGIAHAGMGGGGGGGGASATAAVDKEDFLELMRARFVAGLDEDVDYAAIDADRSLDDDFRALAEQDALDEYFDGD